MRIKVITKHYNIANPGTSMTPQTVQFDFDEEFIFIYEGNLIKINGSSWYKPVNNLEDCFKAIKSYLYGTHYDIVDFLMMDVGKENM